MAAKDQTNDLISKLRGHDHLEVTGDDGTTYTFRFPRKLVKQMTAKGITAQSVGEKLSEGTYNAVEEFVYDFIAPGFQADQPEMTLDEVMDLYESLPEKDEFIQLAVGLFMLPTIALTTDPTKTRAKFRLI